jgi:thioredoxin-related protein
MKKLLPTIFFSFLMVTEAAPTFGASGGTKLLFFYQENCKWCRMMDEVIDDPSITRILRENAQIIKVDIHGQEKLASEGLTGVELKKKYRVFWIPTLIFMGSAPKELLRIPGVVTKEDFRDLICHEVGMKSSLCAK